MNPAIHLYRPDNFIESLTDQVEKRKYWLLAGFSVIYLAVTCLLASQKMMWNDELYTYYISRLSSMSDIWTALMTGAEQIPPFFYTVTRSSMALFGVNELGIRLPEVIGFWVMLISLYLFVTKRAPALYGFLAMLFPLATGTYFYAYEARPYGLVLGFSGLALVSWQAAAEKKDRKIALVVLTASFAAAISCHYFASFVFIALAIGEAVRTYSIRRLDLPVWIAFCLGATPLIAFWPLIGRSMGYSSGFWSKPNLMSLPLFYFLELNPVIFPLMVMVGISAIHPVRGVIDSRKIPASIPRHEIAAALGFAAIPVFTVTLAILITGAFTDRYAITAIIGISIVTAFAIRNLLHNREAIVLILVISISIYFLLSGVRYYRKLSDDRSAHKQTESFLRAHCPEGMPIVISDSHAFTTLAHYASPDLADRIVYLADPEASLRYLGLNSVEQRMLDLA